MNYLSRDPSNIDADVEYALQIAHRYIDEFTRLGVDLSSACVLELGPGRNFGWPLIMTGHGARVIVADRFLADWDEAYHPEFYRRLSERCEGPARAALDQIVRGRKRHDAFPLLRLEEAAETLPSVQDAHCDIVLSHAVLEHVYDLPAAIATFARITAAGGINIHQIDFRDHRDYDRPLEFLLMSDEEFALEPEAVLGRGNRWRLSEVVALFEAAGFEILGADTDTPCDAAYLTEFTHRLMSSTTRFRKSSGDDLRYGGAHLTLRRSH